LQKGGVARKGMTMKFLSQVLFSIGLIGFALTGCERHEFEDTKSLHTGHGEHGHHDDHGDHGDHDDHGDAAKADEKGKEKSAEH